MGVLKMMQLFLDRPLNGEILLMTSGNIYGLMLGMAEMDA